MLAPGKIRRPASVRDPDLSFVDLESPVVKKLRIHPLIQDKAVKAAALGQLIAELTVLRDRFDEDSREELNRIVQGKDPWSDPV